MKWGIYAMSQIKLSKSEAKAYFDATSLEAAARALGLSGKAQFRPRVRSVLGHVSSLGMAKLWTRANAQKLLSDPAIVRAYERNKANAKVKRTSKPRASRKTTMANAIKSIDANATVDSDGTIRTHE
jgi:hypothetical protein